MEDMDTESEVFDVSILANGQAEGDWYVVPGSKVKVRIRPIKPRILKDLRKKWTKTRMRGSKAVEEVNEPAFHNDLLDEIVAEWKNIKKGEEEFPCTRENKIFLDGEWHAFTTLWQAVFAREARVDESIQEAELKN